MTAIGRTRYGCAAGTASPAQRDKALRPLRARGSNRTNMWCCSRRDDNGGDFRRTPTAGASPATRSACLVPPEQAALVVIPNGGRCVGCRDALDRRGR